MTKEQLTNWLNGLRSGNFKQLRDGFYNQDTEEYCCLAVYSKCNNNLKYGILKFPNPKDFGKTEADSPMLSKFINMNDAAKLNFNEIADFAEAYYKDKLDDAQ